MVTGFLQGLLPTLLLTVSLHSPYTPSATLQATNSATISESRYYSVQEGDTLRTIAHELYGSEELWDVLWKDNKWIKNPEIIETSWKLNVRTIKPQLPPRADIMLTSAVNVSQVIEPVAIQPAVVSLPTATPTPSLQVEQPVVNGPLTDTQITFLGNCESGMNPTTNTGNGFYGAFQFTIPTWNAMGTGFERADLAPLSVQMNAVQKLLSRSSIWTQFPGCAAKMRAAGLI